MEEWIHFLKNTDGDLAGDFLLEACMYQGGIRLLCKTAREESARHPILYQYACEYLLAENEDVECEKLGMEAILELPMNLITRGKIADLTARAAKKLGHDDTIKECYVAAFDSESTLKNYLRLFELADYQNITEKAAKYAETLPENSILGLHHKNKQLMVNTLSKEDQNIIRFFNSEFEYIYEDCKKDKATLGWSSRFIGIAVPLFILLLDKDMKLTKAGQQLINGILYRMDYKAGDTNSFKDQFLNWKEKVVLSKEQYEKYMMWLTKEVDKRAEVVVGGGYRKSYYKAAALIAALGEALESNGKLNGRTVTIDHYKKLHTRKSAFKAEFEMFSG